MSPMRSTCSAHHILLHFIALILQGGLNMTGTNCDLFTHKSSRSYLNHLVFCEEHKLRIYSGDNI